MESRRESKQPLRMKRGWHDAEKRIEPCRVRHCYECMQMQENVTCGRVLFTHPVGCTRLPSAVLQQIQKNKLPLFIPLPPWGAGRRIRRIPPLVVMKKDWFRWLFSRFAEETVHYCDCFSEVWSVFHRCISAWVVQWSIPVFPASLIFLRGWAVGAVFRCQFIHCDALLLGPANFELRITKCWISLEANVNSFKFLFDTSLPRVVGLWNALSVLQFLPCRAPRGRPFLMTQRGMERASSRQWWNCWLASLFVKRCPQMQLITRRSSLSNCCWMGCRHYFAATRLDVLHDALKSMSGSSWSNRWIVHSQSPRSYLICVFVFVFVFVFIQTFNRHWHTTLHKSPRAYVGALAAKQDSFVDFLSNRTGWLLTLSNSLRFYTCFFLFGWVCWESSPPPATSQPNSFIQLSLKDIFGGGRDDAYTFSCMISPDPIMVAFGKQ